MKLGEKWLREWVNPDLRREDLIAQTTMAGLAVESCEKANDDYIIDFELTPNRGDCLSVLGIAREIAAINGIELTERAKRFLSLQNTAMWESLIDSTDQIFSIHVAAVADCPRYLGCIIEGIHTNAETPAWMHEKLLQSGINSVSPVVDIMNFVMLELGQPLHAFDLDKLSNGLVIRRAHKDESITLLNGKSVTLDNDVLVIADHDQAQAIAGVMGGLDSAVSENTSKILVESAHFIPAIIAGKARRFGLQTDGSYRFERGVDPNLPLIALIRVIGLLMEILGESCQIFKIIEKSSPENLPARPSIALRASQINKIIGITIPAETVEQLLQRAGMFYKKEQDQWSVTPPSYRFDIAQEVDLIEEIARLYGYQHIPTRVNLLPLQNTLALESQLSVSRLKHILLDQGYNEVITYSFIEPELQQLFDPTAKLLALANPLSADLSVMRSSLWPSLVEVVRYNYRRQQNYCRFFEIGLRFIANTIGLIQEPVLSGVWAGQAFPEQWAEKQRYVDFYDIKNTLVQLHEFYWQAAQHPALHPAQSAALYDGDKHVGWCGALHPEIQNKVDVHLPIFLFEISLDALIQTTVPTFQTMSKFPTVRRDLALIIDQQITSLMIQNCINQTAKPLLIDFCVFDVYQGENIPVGKKSIAVGLIFQAMDRTLMEDEISRLMENIIMQLKQKLAAELRE
jgi:phenylalanyl-tRNA synthetase beta chain